MRIVTLTAGDIRVQVELADTPTADAIWNALPIEGSANVWGDEIYFDIPLTLDLEPDAREDVEIGDLGYWPVGPAFCIFFGQTPVSTNEKPRAASAVNVFGRVTGDATVLKPVSQGATVWVTQ